MRIGASSPVMTARLASGLTLDDVAPLVQMSRTEYVQLEEQPLSFTVEQLGTISHELNRDGKDILRAWLSSFFDLDSDV